ncbi:hypothetical protein KRX19_06625 [Cardiobacteriaceae bacterium TAE3-ERU3]|nr:hypothetical protein [Cardiobacteriaceae bacterium TAE3-ERU3]
MQWRDWLAKEWRLLLTPAMLWAMLLLWLGEVVYLLAALEAYNGLADQLARLSNRRGATQMLLAHAGGVVNWLMIVWLVYFGARSLAQERQWGTDFLWRSRCGGRWRLLLSKAAVLLLGLLLVVLPYWLWVIGLTFGTDWDDGLLLGIALSQVLLALYGVGLALTVSAACVQPLTASLLLGLLWLLLWLLPVLASSPQWLNAMLRWLSPFEHVALLQQGILSSQTGVFFVMMLLAMATLTSIFWIKE